MLTILEILQSDGLCDSSSGIVDCTENLPPTQGLSPHDFRRTFAIYWMLGLILLRRRS